MGSVRTLLMLGCLLALMLLAAPMATADDGGTGTLRGTVTIVGPTQLRDGVVEVIPKGSNESLAYGNFSWQERGYELALPPGEYTAYAAAPVHHTTARVPFTIEANRTTWLNFTIVRIEEVIGRVNSTGGGPVEEVAVTFEVDGSTRWAARTDASGAFRTTLDAGNYTLRAVKAGFKEHTSALEVAPGQVVRVDLQLEPVGGGGDDGGLDIVMAVILVVVVLSAGGSFGYVGLQARRIRRAMETAEARRERGSLCVECGADIPKGSGRCPRCGHVLQARCSGCGRLVDVEGAPDTCPECGALLR